MDRRPDAAHERQKPQAYRCPLLHLLRPGVSISGTGGWDIRNSLSRFGDTEQLITNQWLGFRFENKGEWSVSDAAHERQEPQAYRRPLLHLSQRGLGYHDFERLIPNQGTTYPESGLGVKV